MAEVTDSNNTATAMLKHESKVDHDSSGTIDTFYTNAQEYWKKIDPTIDGMLGGYARISPTDINGSCSFLRPLLKAGGGNTGTRRALDCGAGIGRVTKRLLLPIFQAVDMVDVDETFCGKARRFIGSDASRVGDVFCCGLQNFTPVPRRYDVIWCQWVLSHLRDSDLVTFMRRCRSGLSEGGLVVVKGNVAGGEEVIFDQHDSSFVRTRGHLLRVLEKSGLRLQSEVKQKGFPKDIYAVYMFALDSSYCC